MLKKKLNILLLTSLSVLFLGLFSTSYAYTYDDLIGYATYITTESNAPADIKLSARTLLNRQNFIKQKISASYNIDNIKSILCHLRNSSGGIAVFFTFNSGNYSVSNNQINIGSNVYVLNVSSNVNDSWAYTGQVGSAVYIQKNDYFGLLDNTNEFIDYTGFWLNNMYSTEPTLDFTPNYNISNLTVLSHTGVNGIYSRKLEDPIWRYD